MSTSTIFTGSSRYSSDFQSVIDRSVAIASLPLNQLQAQKTTLSDESTALASLDSKVAAVQAAIASIQSALGVGGYRTSISDDSVISATVAGGAMPGSYRIHVDSTGSRSSGMSKDGLVTVADPSTTAISTYGTYTLTVGGKDYAVQPASHTLNSLADAINASGAGVLATVVNTGPPDAPDYRLALESNSLGAVDIQLAEGSTLVDDTGTTLGTLPQVTDPAASSISTASKFTLRVDGTDYAITPAGQSLNDLADAINQNAQAGVQADIVDVGSGGNHDYRLKLTPSGASKIQLIDGSNVFDQLATGEPAKYTVNGKPGAVESSSATVTLASGLTVNLLKAGDATVTVSQTTDSVATALSGFAGAYNALMAELDKHRGGNAGALSGNSVLSTIKSALSQITSYSAGGGSIGSAAVLGLGFAEDRSLQLDTAMFNDSVGGDFSKLAAFMGDSETGGFLKAATDALNSLEEPGTGAVKAAITSVQDLQSANDARISREQDRIDSLRTRLQEQMAAADALIASLEQQVTYITGMFDSMRAASGSMQ